MKKVIFTIALTIFLVSFISAAVINVDKNCVNTIPGDDPLCDDGITYLTIQGAVDAATAGDTVNVSADTYTDPINLCSTGDLGMVCVTKSLRITGQPGGTTILDGGAASASGFVVSSSNVI